MKKIMKEAHKMTREMVEKYGVDYRTQLGLNLSYLLKNKEEEEMEYKVIFRENGEMDQMVVEAESKLDAIFAAKKNRVVTAYEIETEMDREYLRFDKCNTIDFTPADRRKFYSDIYVDENGRHVSKRLIEGTLYFDAHLRIYDENGNYIADGIEVA